MPICLVPPLRHTWCIRFVPRGSALPVGQSRSEATVSRVAVSTVFLDVDQGDPVNTGAPILQRTATHAC